ncbi:acylneuraminate cytidylyltransferase family protein [Parapedobacter lycopersici]|uniref:acylneuraminate cytidylyltransferase family protein n=1 Tax=Parapedobacter lycopersici TaxID=1864939 RepID=UPI00214DAB0A|nr:acylneuraminate cytidylyltransferase family protein [Parapedobacter lycopersici]
MLAIIPARGGSKGLPHKNILELNGKPLIAYTIEAAKKSSHIDKVIVSTDDEKIAQIAQKFGAECPFLRPAELATDTARSIDVFKHVVKMLSESDNVSVDQFAVLQPTSPLRTSKDIDNAIGLFLSRDADSVVSFCKEDHPIVWHKYVDTNGLIHPIFDNYSTNRQQNQPTYYPNGAIYIFKTRIIEQDLYFTDRSYAYLMDRVNSLDIDTKEDFDYVEFLIKGNTPRC